MHITIDLPDELADAMRLAFSVQDTPATDEGLAEVCRRYLLDTALHVHSSTVRAALNPDVKPEHVTAAMAHVVALRAEQPTEAVSLAAIAPPAEGTDLRG